VTRGNVANYVYDPAGRLTSVTTGYGTPQATTTAYAYDDAGNQTSVTDGNNHTTGSAYDARRRLTATTYPIVPPATAATTTTYAYDGPGNLALVTDQAQNQVQYTYDFNNQLRQVIQLNHPDPSHNSTAYNYDTNGNLTTLEDANTHITTNAFDVFNQLNLEQMPAGQQQTRTYDAAGNLQTLTDYNGKITTYAYDSLNRLITRTPDPSLPDAPESFTYTPTGKRATMTDPSGTTVYTYDAQDRLQIKATPQGTLTYAYDPAGNLASMTSSNANGVSVSYTYDSLNRLATVVDNRLPAGQNTTTYSYDPASNLATVTYPNGLQSSFTYDTLNRVTGLSNAAASYTYTLDGTVGNRKGVTERLASKPNPRIVAWNYDDIYRLTNEDITADPNSKTGSVTYGLDPVGNRLSLGLSQGSNLPGISPILPGSVSYDPDDRLSTETYDANGNTLTTAGKTFAYDFANRLKSMTAASVTVTIQYDADGNRVSKTVNGVTTRYLVDDLNPTGYAQVVEEVTAGAVTRQYTYGLQRISQTQQIANAWTPAFYGYDGAGTVRLLTDSTGTVTDTYDYDAWGNEVNETGSTPNVYLYRGEQYDSDLRLYYLRARYLNPLSGRFVTRAPVRGMIRRPKSLHQYLYAEGNPVRYVDPTGHPDIYEYKWMNTMICGGSLYCGPSLTQVAGAAALVGVVGSYVMRIWFETDERLCQALPREPDHSPEEKGEGGGGEEPGEVCPIQGPPVAGQ